jgi:hypothetical protein
MPPYAVVFGFHLERPLVNTTRADLRRMNLAGSPILYRDVMLAQIVLHDVCVKVFQVVLDTGHIRGVRREFWLRAGYVRGRNIKGNYIDNSLAT